MVAHSVRGPTMEISAGRQCGGASTEVRIERSAQATLAQITELAARADSIAELEIGAHGNPALCNGIAGGNVVVIAESLRRIVGSAQKTTVVLSGCNTGLEFMGDCVARSFADAFAGTVYGAAGYVAGTYAEQTFEFG